MLAAGIACYRAWRAEGGAEPAVVAGHSLGEYTRAGGRRRADAGRRAAAGALSRPGDAGGGAGGRRRDGGDPRRWSRRRWSKAARKAAADSGEVVEAANFNDPKQTVIAGSKAGVEKACEVLKAMGAKRALPLPVSAPFHSSLMQPGGRAAAPAPGRRGRSPRRASRWSTTSTSRCETDPRRDPRCAVPPGLRPGALGRGGAGHARARHDATSSSAARARCWPAWSSASMPSCHGRRVFDPAVAGRSAGAAGMSEICRARSRWSPARRAASAARSRGTLAAQGFKVIGTATSEAGAAGHRRRRWRLSPGCRGIVPGRQRRARRSTR